MPATQWPPGALETPCLVSHACCRTVNFVIYWEKRIIVGEMIVKRYASLLYVSVCETGGQRYRSGTRANQRSKIDTYICRNVESIDSSGCSEHLQGDSGWNARRVPFSTEISQENDSPDTGDSLVYWHYRWKRRSRTIN